MNGEILSNEEDYAFDVAGYLHVPGVLKPEEVEALNQALDGMGESTGMLGWSTPQLASISKVGLVFKSDCGTRLSVGSSPTVVGLSGR